MFLFLVLFLYFGAIHLSIWRRFLIELRVSFRGDLGALLLFRTRRDQAPRKFFLLRGYHNFKLRSFPCGSFWHRLHDLRESFTRVYELVLL